MGKRKVYEIEPLKHAAERERWAVSSNIRVRATSSGRALRFAAEFYDRMATSRGRPCFEVCDLEVRSIDRSLNARWDERV